MREWAQVCDNIAVMYKGEVVEYGSTVALFAQPQHAYARELLNSVPGRDWISTTAGRPSRRPTGAKGRYEPGSLDAVREASYAAQRGAGDMIIDWTPLARNVEVHQRDADIGVSVIAPGGEHWAHNGDVQYPSASTVKIPIMIEVYRMIDRGTVALDDLHTLRPADKSPGSGVLRHLHAGLALSVADLLYLMMSISDNTATNMLIEMAGMDGINTTMRALGMTDSILGRPMRGRLAVEGEQENLATPNDYTRVLDAIFGDTAASRAACSAMAATLERQQNSRRIGRHVPAREGYRWGSKTGSNKGIVNDVGFVCGPAGRMLIAVYCRGVADEVTGEHMIADITRKAMEVVGLV